MWLDFSASVKDYSTPAIEQGLAAWTDVQGRRWIILNNSQHNNGVKLTKRPTPQCRANPLRGVIIAPFQEPLGQQTGLG
jgi:hypothetical protein